MSDSVRRTDSRDQGPFVVKYLPGLNGLRFIAALLVIARHASQSAIKIGVYHDVSSKTIFFDRGLAAVDLFFTLSGFLITYLLLQEIANTGTVSLKGFYIRRMCRIWPLYYLVLVLGWVLLSVVFPRLYGETYFTFNQVKGFLLFLFFMPLWMASFYKVGMLLVLWSIGVEEQFYLVWAPCMKWFGHRMLWLSGAFIALTFGFYAIYSADLFPMSDELSSFLWHLRFHYMAVGSFFAWLLFYKGRWYRESVFAGIPFQCLTLAVLVYHYIWGFPGRAGLDAILALCYGSLILSVSVAPKRLLNLEWEPLIYLGKISYGVYMFHMFGDYIVRAVFLKAHLSGHDDGRLFFGYFLAAALVTIGCAALSYRYIEHHFLRLGHKASAGVMIRRAAATAA